MACTSLSIPSSPASMRTAEAFREQKGLRQSQSSQDLYRRANMRRCYSDNHLCYRIKRVRAASVQPKLKNSRSMGFFPFQFSSSILPNSVRSFLFNGDTSKLVSMAEREMEMGMGMKMVDSSEEVGDEEGEQGIKRANWVERLVEIRSKWRNKQQKEVGEDESGCQDVEDADCQCGEGGCSVDYSTDEEDGEITSKFFGRFLEKVTWSDTKQFSQLAFLSNLAYVISLIKADDLKRYCSLQFVTSSIEKKAQAAGSTVLKEIDEDASRVPVDDEVSSSEAAIDSEKKHFMHPSIAYEIAASAANYVRTCDKDGGDVENSSRYADQQQHRDEGGSSPRNLKSEVAASLTAKAMTIMVAAEEKVKQETAKDLQSPNTAPCEWFVCDDTSTYTRCFVIQGSDSLASWQANLFFEPTKFEETNVLVHRGIYEAAKGMYEQFLPYILEHLKKHGERAKLQFTGHSLGGSLSLLVHLMLLTKNTVNPSTLRPVVTFGSPFVFCGGQKILDDLGVDENQIHCVMMHRDIVPRAFSCIYPTYVATLLKRLSGSFRSHPCLIKKKMLYSPMGKLFILQPDESSSPLHPLLPAGSSLYALDKTRQGYSSNVLRAFLNNPHPLETLSDPKAYGSEGTILRDHDSSNYLKAMNGVLKLNTRKVLRVARKQKNILWPLLASPSQHAWNHEKSMESGMLMNQEILTGV